MKSEVSATNTKNTEKACLESKVGQNIFHVAQKNKNKKNAINTGLQNSPEDACHKMWVFSAFWK